MHKICLAHSGHNVTLANMKHIEADWNGCGPKPTCRVAWEAEQAYQIMLSVNVSQHTSLLDWCQKKGEVKISGQEGMRDSPFLTSHHDRGFPSAAFLV